MNTAGTDRLAIVMDSLWDFRDAKTSETRFREAAEAADEESMQLQLLTQVARAQGLQRKFDEAHATLDGVEQAVRKLPKDGVAATVLPLYLIERGRVYNSSGESERARLHFQQAWEGALAVKQDALAVDAAHMLGIVASGDEAIEWNQRALKHAEASSEDRARRWRASLHNNLGWTYHERGEYQRALDHFERALEEREERGEVREVLIARWAIARCLRSLERAEEALVHQQELMTEWQKVSEEDGYNVEEIGECLLLLRRPEEARPYFARAHEILQQDQWLSANEPERLKRLANLGGVAKD